jgi:hypothetical protein
MPGRACYRDSSGRRVFGAVTGSVSYDKPYGRGDLSFTLVEAGTTEPLVTGPEPLRQAFVWDLTGGAEFPPEAVDGDVGIDLTTGDVWRFVA